MKSYQVVGIGNAIVDVFSAADDSFLELMGIQKGIMQLVERERGELLYGAMTNRQQAPGGSVANTLAGLGNLGLSTAFIGRVHATAAVLDVADLAVSVLVLVIDDESEVRATARAMLEARSYDLCLTDMRMGDGDGLTLVRHIGLGLGRVREHFAALFAAAGGQHAKFPVSRLGVGDARHHESLLRVHLGRPVVRHQPGPFGSGFAQRVQQQELGVEPVEAGAAGVGQG